jgi:hypothetical protein
MKPGNPNFKKNPPKRLSYKGHTYVLAARSTAGITWEKTLPIIEQLQGAAQGIVEDEHTLYANSQTVADAWYQLNQYFKLLLPRQ